MLKTTVFLMVSLSVMNDLAAQDEARSSADPKSSTSEVVLFDFKTPDARRQWQTVNDGVMGGRSDGRFRFTNEGILEFFGNLSLANNGGFASVRSQGRALNLRAGDELVIKVKGDGRKYTFNLYTPNRRTAFSYRAEFETLKDQWSESRMPVDQFVATSFGRKMPSMKLDPTQVTGIGILLGDKKPGSFQLQIDSIRVIRKK